MIGRAYGVDLGTSDIKIYKKGKGIVVDQKNVIAVENNRHVIAVGDEAFEMYEKTPENVEVTQPIRNGVIADIAHMEVLFNSFIKMCSKKGKVQSAEYVVAIPMDITEVEKKAFIDLIESSRAKIKKVGVVSKPIAAAVGAGLDVNNAHGVMMVDIGASTTEISIISLGGIVISKLVPIGGETFSEAIMMAVKKKYNLFIGQKTASRLKMALGNVTNSNMKVEDLKNEEMENSYFDEKNLDNESVKDKQSSMRVYGRNMISGLPEQVEVKAELVIEAMKEALASIMESIKTILERTPPEISSDIIDSGIYISGGSATIEGLDKLVEEHTGLTVNVCEDSRHMVVKGLGKILETPSLNGLICQFIK